MSGDGVGGTESYVGDAADVQECADVSVGLERLGSYELYDLVLLDRTSAGVIVKVEHSSFKARAT